MELNDNILWIPPDSLRKDLNSSITGLPILPMNMWNNVIYSKSDRGFDGNILKADSPGKLQKEVEKGQAPKEVDRVDKPHVDGQKPHVHLNDGTSLNNDGTVHDKHKGNPNPSKRTKEWLKKHGWVVD